MSGLSLSFGSLKTQAIKGQAQGLVNLSGKENVDSVSLKKTNPLISEGKRHLNGSTKFQLEDQENLGASQSSAQPKKKAWTLQEVRQTLI